MSDDVSEADRQSIEILYNESKAALDVIDQLLIRYRANTTTVLALGTGATTLFGFSSAPKGVFFVATLVCYALGVLAALAIYAPQKWRDNIYDPPRRRSRNRHSSRHLHSCKAT
jgi:hypothetical protein